MVQISLSKWGSGLILAVLQCQHVECSRDRFVILVLMVMVMVMMLDDLLVLVGKWADPGGTAMPGQPATRPEQAPEPHPLAKISLI